MIYVLDTEAMAKYSLTQEEYFMLILWSAINKTGKSQETILNSLLEKHLLDGHSGVYTVNKEGYNILEQVYAESKLKDVSNDNLMALATQLRELFPKGNKDGTNSPWRESAALIAKRLVKFFGRFGKEYNNPEKILAATKEYVDSFNGDYAYMRTLKYFIMKDEIKYAEDGKCYIDLVSDLATHMDNLGEVSVTNYDNGRLLV